MGDFTIKSREELETSGKWTLVRRTIELESFGMNIVDLAPGEDIPAHDETGRDQEEVFVALAGSPTMVVDGDEHELPEGAFARLDPDCHRTVVNKTDSPARVLICSAPRSSGYEPMEWA